MPKVHHVRAAKDYDGIPKGTMYYTWKLRHGPVRRSLTPPRRSQLTGSEFKSNYYELVDTSLPACKTADDLRSLAGEVRELGEGQAAKVEEMPENLQQGSTAEMLRNRGDELEAWADELEGLADDVGEEDEFDPETSLCENWAELLSEKLEEAEQSAPDPE